MIVIGWFTCVSTRPAGRHCKEREWNSGKGADSAAGGTPARCPAPLSRMAGESPGAETTAPGQHTDGAHRCPSSTLTADPGQNLPDVCVLSTGQYGSVRKYSWAVTRPKQTHHVALPGELLLAHKTPVQAAFLRVSLPIPLICTTHPFCLSYVFFRETGNLPRVALGTGPAHGRFSGHGLLH